MGKDNIWSEWKMPRKNIITYVIKYKILVVQMIDHLPVKLSLVNEKKYSKLILTRL